MSRDPSPLSAPDNPYAPPGEQKDELDLALLGDLIGEGKRPFFVVGDLLAVHPDLEGVQLPKVCLLTGRSTDLMKRRFAYGATALRLPDIFGVNGYVNHTEWTLRHQGSAKFLHPLKKVKTWLAPFFIAFLLTNIPVVARMLKEVYPLYIIVAWMGMGWAIVSAAEMAIQYQNRQWLKPFQWHFQLKSYHFLRGLSPEVLAELATRQDPVSHLE